MYSFGSTSQPDSASATRSTISIFSSAATSSTETDQEASNGASRGLTKGPVIGIGVGSGVTVAAASCLVTVRCFPRRYQQKKEQPPPPVYQQHGAPGMLYGDANPVFSQYELASKTPVVYHEARGPYRGPQEMCAGVQTPRA